MSGPDLDRPRPGSNAIGQFQIGVSPIGTITPFDYWQTIITQYANSPIIDQLIANFSAYVDQTKNLQDFFDNAFNLATAFGWGLDVLGRKLNVGRVLQIAAGDFLGFAESTTAETFGYGTFNSGARLTQNFALADAPYRTLLFAKALANIWDGSTPGLNAILLALFPNRGNCFVQEGAVFDGKYFGFDEAAGSFGFGQAPFNSDRPVPFMYITYVFDFALTPVELAIVRQSGAIPRPCGVKAAVNQLG